MGKPSSKRLSDQPIRIKSFDFLFNHRAKSPLKSISYRANYKALNEIQENHVDHDDDSTGNKDGCGRLGNSTDSKPAGVARGILVGSADWEGKIVNSQHGPSFHKARIAPRHHRSSSHDRTSLAGKLRTARRRVEFLGESVGRKARSANHRSYVCAGYGWNREDCPGAGTV